MSCCPAPGCEVHAGPGRFACRPHWYSLPKPLRDALWRAYRGSGVYSADYQRAAADCTAFLSREAPA